MSYSDGNTKTEKPNFLDPDTPDLDLQIFSLGEFMKDMAQLSAHVRGLFGG